MKWNDNCMHAPIVTFISLWRTFHTISMFHLMRHFFYGSNDNKYLKNVPKLSCVSTLALV